MLFFALVGPSCGRKRILTGFSWPLFDFKCLFNGSRDVGLFVNHLTAQLHLQVSPSRNFEILYADFPQQGRQGCHAVKVSGAEH